jgi:CRP/FNR family cyclic AMP-dependent transcriptional regulator
MPTRLRATTGISSRTVRKVARNLVGILARRVRLANARAQMLATLDVPGRVAGQILVLAREYGEGAADGSVRIPLCLTQSDLAGMVGASRASVNRALGFYRRHGYLSVDRRHRITVHDPDGLARRAR